MSDISDHFSQFCINQPDKWQTKHREKICDFSHFSESSFNADLAQINWISIIANKRDNIDKLFTTFYDKVNNLTSKYAPLKLISKRMIKQFSKPWITKGIRRVIKIKNKYKLYRNKITILTRINKKSYFHKYFNNNLTNMRKTWEGINNLINRKITVFIRCPIKKEMIKSPKDIPDILNKHFSTIGKKLASKLPNSNTHFSQYLNSHNYLNSFFLYMRSRYICYRKHTVAHSHSPTSLYNFNYISQSAISLHQLFTSCPHLTRERASFGLVLFKRSRLSPSWNICCLIFSPFYLRNYSEVSSSINMETLYTDLVSGRSLRRSKQSLRRAKQSLRRPEQANTYNIVHLYHTRSYIGCINSDHCGCSCRSSVRKLTIKKANAIKRSRDRALSRLPLKRIILAMRKRKNR